MKLFRHMLPALLVAALLSPSPSPASWWNPLTTIVGETLFQPAPGTVKVPWSEPCPSYATWFSAAEKEKTRRMADFAKFVYMDLGSSITEVYPVPGKAEYTFGGDSRMVADLIGTEGKFQFQYSDAGVITIPGMTGFQALIQHDAQTGHLVVSFRGSEGKVPQLGDWVTDGMQALGSSTSQYEAAAELLQRILANTPGEQIDVVGHSLGGGLVQYAMAMNDLQGRVEGYTFNSAGLSKATIESLSAAGIADAGAHITNVRVVGDPVSFAESHIGNIFDVDKADRDPETGVATGNAHSIDTMIASLRAAPNTDGPGKDLAPKASGGDGEDPLAALTEWLGEGLSSFLPADITGPLLQTMEDYVRAKVMSELLAKAGVVDAKIGEWLAKAAALKEKLYSILPDDASRRAFDGMVSDVLSGNFDHLSESAKQTAYAISDHYIDKGLRDLGVGDDERAAILKTYHDAADAWLAGGDVGGTITGNFESYLFGKIRDELGEKAAESWKDVWADLKAGTDAWENFGKAALDTIEVVSMRELQEALDKGFAWAAKNCPALAEFCRMCGIDTASVMELAGGIWGVVRGDGTPAEKIEAICDLVVEQLGAWFESFVASLVDKAFQLALSLADWLAGEVNKCLESLDRLVGKLRDKGFHPQFSSLVDYAVKVASSRAADAATLVVDFAVDAAVDTSCPASSGNQPMEVVHDEAF